MKGDIVTPIKVRTTKYYLLNDGARRAEPRGGCWAPAERDTAGSFWQYFVDWEDRGTSYALPMSMFQSLAVLAWLLRGNLCPTVDDPPELCHLRKKKTRAFN